MDDLLGKIQEVLSDPESMQQISELAQMLKNESPPPPTGEAAGEATSEHTQAAPDPAMFLKIGQLLNNAQQPDQNTALLLALRPHLGEKRQERVDRAVKLLRLLTVFHELQDSGMLQNLI